MALHLLKIIKMPVVQNHKMMSTTSNKLALVRGFEKSKPSSEAVEKLKKTMANHPKNVTSFLCRNVMLSCLEIGDCKTLNQVHGVAVKLGYEFKEDVVESLFECQVSGYSPLKMFGLLLSHHPNIITTNRCAIVTRCCYDLGLLKTVDQVHAITFKLGLMDKTLDSVYAHYLPTQRFPASFHQMVPIDLFNSMLSVEGFMERKGTLYGWLPAFEKSSVAHWKLTKALLVPELLDFAKQFLFKWMIAKGMKPNMCTVTTMLKFLPDDGKPMCRGLHVYAIKTGFYTQETRSLLLSAYSKNVLFGYAIDVFLDGQVSDVKTLNSFIFSLAHRGMTQPVLKCLQRLIEISNQNNNLIAVPNTLDDRIRGFLRAMVLPALQPLQEAVEVGIPPDGETILAIMNACDHTGYLEEAHLLLFNMFGWFGIQSCKHSS